MAMMSFSQISMPTNPQVIQLEELSVFFENKKKDKKKKKKAKKCCKNYKKKDGKMCKDCPKLKQLSQYKLC